MSLDEHDAPQRMGGSRRAPGIRFWTGAGLAGVGILLMVTSMVGPINEAMAAKAFGIALSFGFLVATLIDMPAAREVLAEREQTAKRIDEACREIGDGARPRSNRFSL